jgi:hypothetical protein
MVFQDFLPKGGRIYVGIDFCGTDAFVSQHGLNGTQIGPSLKQRSSKGMAQGMW